MAVATDRKGSLAVINEFLACKRLAIVGISRTETDISRALWKEFRTRGYEVVPVNPALNEIEGEKCYASLRDLPQSVDWVLLTTAPAVSEQVVCECAELGIKRVWFYRGTGAGAVSENALEFCAAQGIETVPGQCPFMFLPDTAFFHRLHGFGKKLTGKYPK
jgi:predicted CoA-binding protein